MQKTKKWRILVLSTLATSFLTLQTAEAATYTVQKGDTLSKIAQNHQVTIADIMKWNNLSKDTIYVAQQLDIQKQATSDSKKPSVPSASTKPTTTSHTVAKGDTLSKIAKQYNVTIKDIMNWNKLEKDTIYIGQVLKISPGAVIPEGGLKIGRASSEGYFNGNTTSVQNPVPGDLVFFENTYKEGISHMGIYLGDNKFVHAGTDGVEISDVTYPYWSSKLVAYKRFDSVK